MPSTKTAPMASIAPAGKSPPFFSRRTLEKGAVPAPGWPRPGEACGPLKGEVLGPDVCIARAPEDAGPGVWTDRGPVAVVGIGGGATAAAVAAPEPEACRTKPPVGLRCAPLCGAAVEALAVAVAGVALATAARWVVSRGSGAGGGVGRAPPSTGYRRGGGGFSGALALARVSQGSLTLWRSLREPSSTWYLPNWTRSAWRTASVPSRPSKRASTTAPAST